MEFSYTFPAIKGIQAGKEYYSTMIPLNLLEKLFVFNEEIDDICPEYRAQRNLNIKRIPEIGQYILNNRDSYIFSSLTASVDGKISFESLDNKNIGYLHVSMDSKFLINDGQHRKAAIKYALERDPSLKDETISIVLFKDMNLKNSQQMFSDLNRYAITPNRSIGILYDNRDYMAILTKKIVEKVSLFNLYTEKENSSLAKYSPKVFTIANIYEANKKLIGNNKLDEDFLIRFWNDVFSNIKEFQFVLEKKLSPFELRKNYILGFGIWLEAIGIIGNSFYGNKDNSYLKLLNTVDWQRENNEWKHRTISQGRIIKNKDAVQRTVNLIKIKLGIKLSEEEKTLEEGKE